MAGHSKWANRLHRKSRQDAKKGKVFGKLSREIIVAARLGGADPAANNRLRLAIQAAKAARMPSDNIERAIKRGSGEADGESYDEVVYEGFGPGNVYLMLGCLTDNRQRTVSEVRNILDRHGGTLADAGSVAYLFERKGLVVVAKGDGMDSEQLFLEAAEAGAEDVRDEGDYFEITTDANDLAAVLERLNAAGITEERAELTYVPKVTQPVPDEQARKLLNLLELLDEHDDVQRVYSNFEVSDAVLAALEN